jgi:hypothetical protein
MLDVLAWAPPNLEEAIRASLHLGEAENDAPRPPPKPLRTRDGRDGPAKR